jgi:hypothetical protein
MGMPAAPWVILGAAVLAALVSCGGGDRKVQQSAEAGAKAASAAHPPLQTATEQTATMVEAPTLGKATAPVRLKYELVQRPVAGQTILVQLALIPGTAAQSLTLQFGEHAGLVLADHSDRQLGAVHADTAYQLEISASAPADGVFFLNLGATVTHDAITETRNFSIPIIVAAS